jgi:chromosome segregation ATPase
LDENSQKEIEPTPPGTVRPDQKYDDSFWAKVQKGVVICSLLFLGGAFVLTGFRTCSGREAGDTAVSVELERITGELEHVKGELRDTEQRAVELTAELYAARSELERVTTYSKKLEVELGSAGAASMAIGRSINILDGANTAVENAVRDIDRIINEANQANGVP